MSFDADVAIRHIRNTAMGQSTGSCAKHVRLALEAGGVDLTTRPNYACQYGPYLEARGFVGFVPGNWDQFHPMPGDVSVIQPHPGGHPAGHICMYCGDRPTQPAPSARGPTGGWISDFVQNDMWGGPGFRKYKPPTTIYRYGSGLSSPDPGTGNHDVG